MSKHHPTSGRPLPVADLRSSPLSHAASPAASAADLLTLLDVNDREDANKLMSFTLLHAPSTISSLLSLPAFCIMHHALPAKGWHSRCVSISFAVYACTYRGGGVLLFNRGGGLRGFGGGGRGGLRSALTPRQAQGGGARAQLASYPRPQALLSGAFSLMRQGLSLCALGGLAHLNNFGWQTKAPFTPIVVFYPTGRDPLVPRNLKPRP